MGRGEGGHENGRGGEEASEGKQCVFSKRVRKAFNHRKSAGEMKSETRGRDDRKKGGS